MNDGIGHEIRITEAQASELLARRATEAVIAEQMKRALDANGLRYRHIASRVFETPLLMEPGKLRAIATMIAARMCDSDFVIETSIGDRRRERPEPIDGIAVIDVYGSLVQRSSWLSAVSGMSSYQEIAAAVQEAIEADDVDGILLRIDSPGGEAHGVFDLADQIFALADNPKPIWSIAADIGASAAYLIGSSASRFYATQSAIIGSIGVAMAHLDVTERNQQAGVKITEIYAGKRKIDTSPNRPIDDDARAHLQSVVDGLYQLFVSQVSRNRNLAAADVAGTEARLFVGEEAVDRGLVDGVNTVEGTVALMRDELGKRAVIAIGADVKGEVMPAIQPHTTATSDASWDGPANEARLRNDEAEAYYRKAYAWQDPDGDPKTKAAYSFIHHEVDGDGNIGAANITACRSTIGILNGGRGGGPGSRWWGDRRGIYNHAARHIRDADLEPPPLREESEMPEETKTDTGNHVVDVEPAGNTLTDEERRATADAERARLAGIEALSMPGQEKLIAEMKADPDVSVDQAARRIVEAVKAGHKSRLAALRDDEEDVDVEPMVDGQSGELDERAEIRRTLELHYSARGLKYAPPA